MSANTTNSFTPKQESAITALLNEPTVGKAAESLKVNERTLRRWMDEPGFMAVYRKARRESFKHAISLCQKYVPHAVQTLVQIMADKTAPHNSKVSASTALMKFSRESLELDDLAERVVRLETSRGDQESRQDGRSASR